MVLFLLIKTGIKIKYLYLKNFLNYILKISVLKLF